jgi:hypothetical protein
MTCLGTERVGEAILKLFDTPIGKDSIGHTAEQGVKKAYD